MLPEAELEMQSAMLKDPAVQAAIQKVGNAGNALSNPDVQAQMLKVAKEKFPQYGDLARSKSQDWANDPEVQAKAYHYAGVAGRIAEATLGKGGEYTMGLVEQGPTGVRLLAFVAGVASCVNAVLFCLGVGHLLHIVAYVVCIYQFAFAVTTMIFEAPPSLIEKIPGFSVYEDMLIEKAAFLSDVLGRGLFYIFKGSLWLCFSNIRDSFSLCDLVVGAYLVAVGLLHVAMHYGKLGEVASKMREGYSRMKVGATGSAPSAS